MWGMGIKDDLDYILHGNSLLKQAKAIGQGLQDKLDHGHLALPRKGPVPKEMAHLDQSITTPIVVSLIKGGPYSLILSIPSRFRKALGWVQGDRVIVERVGNTLLLTKVEE